MECPKCKKRMRELTDNEYEKRAQDSGLELEIILENCNIFICDNCQYTFEID